MSDVKKNAKGKKEKLSPAAPKSNSKVKDEKVKESKKRKPAARKRAISPSAADSKSSASTVRAAVGRSKRKRAVPVTVDEDEEYADDDADGAAHSPHAAVAAAASATSAPSDRAVESILAPSRSDDFERRVRSRAVSPPPRVLPKRSLAQILRDGAAGVEPEEDSQNNGDTGEAAAGSASGSGDGISAASRVVPPRAPVARVSAVSSQPVPMDMSSQ